ncbi:MAG: PilZ domain-containing protein [Deltaproteobacteria bacterium]|nr:PilZ domain-containing protein [Deltaproteobacteria bacterium]
MIDSDKEDRCFQDSSDTRAARGDSGKNPGEGTAHDTREEMEGKFLLPPPLFKHRELTKIPKSAPRIDKRKLTNIINHLNFTDGYLWAHLKDPRHEEDIFIHAYPQPCMGETITCRWSKENMTGFEYHRFLNLVLDDGMSVTVVPVKLLNINKERFTIQMPDTGYVLGKRQARRFPCQGVTAELSQSGFLARGELLDFSPLSFRIRVAPCLDGSFHWLNPDEPITLTLCQGQKIIFSDPCRFIDQTSSMSVKEIVLAPLTNQFHRFRGRKIRSPRVQLAPSSSISFKHPFSGKRVQRDIHDISVTGFAVHERDDECVLVPGMIIPQLNINCSGAAALPCTAQVVYRRKEKGGLFRCGMVILDMDVTAYGKLSNILGNVVDPNVRVSEETDMDALWKFFFETGFLYPKKYHLIESHRNTFKETYRKLYQDNPEIAEHMVYQRNGQIYGHVSMVKAYERSWMVHHLAARQDPGTNKNTGIPLLRQIINYFEGFYRLPGFNMDHWICYYRPQTRFMDMFFGDFARHLRNPRACSLDTFAYKNYPTTSPQGSLPDGWLLKKFSPPDLFEVERFYRNHANGLLLDALRLGTAESDSDSLEELYKRNGFTRRWKVYSLMHADELKAVLIVNQSDLGLNLSELLNGIKIIITDPTGLPWDILSSAVTRLTGIYEVEKIPLLVYPHTYMEDNGIPYEKQYIMFVMDMQHGKDFLDYLKGRLKAKIRFLIKFLIRKYLKK